MNISGSTGSSVFLTPATKPITRQDVPGDGTSASARSAEAESFFTFMKQSPAEMMQDAWLKRHGISKEEFAAMGPAERQKIVDQMTRELREEAKKLADEQTRGQFANLLA